MADKRMFCKTIVDSDAFLDMPLSAQALYFHLSMRADDDGFLNNAKKIQKIINASEDDLKILLLKRFVIAFDGGIIVIKHWRMNNYLRSDRYKPTVYQEELSMLEIKENGAYSLKNEVENLIGIPSGNQMATQYSIDKNRLDKDSIDKNNIVEQDASTEQFLQTCKEIIDYLNMVLGTNYRYKTKNTQKHINARLENGYSVDDFKTVIEKKCKEWKGTEYERYLCPDTLFGTKFEKYLNQNIVERKSQQPYQGNQPKKIDWDNV